MLWKKIHQQSIIKAWIYRVLCWHGVVGCVMVMCIGPEVRGMCGIFLEVFGMLQHFSEFFRMKEKFTDFFECPLHGVCVLKRHPLMRHPGVMNDYRDFIGFLTPSKYREIDSVE